MELYSLQQSPFRRCQWRISSWHENLAWTPLPVVNLPSAVTWGERECEGMCNYNNSHGDANCSFWKQQKISPPFPVPQGYNSAQIKLAQPVTMHDNFTSQLSVRSYLLTPTPHSNCLIVWHDFGFTGKCTQTCMKCKMATRMAANGPIKNSSGNARWSHSSSLPHLIRYASHPLKAQ